MVITYMREKKGRKFVFYLSLFFHFIIWMGALRMKQIPFTKTPKKKVDIQFCYLSTLSSAILAIVAIE